ncbi:MAG: hypothetical protein KDD84_24845, partial [Caldilineaceae bacterium]|nr:hypothetical protein [Caldilineaceae bacterium]
LVNLDVTHEKLIDVIRSTARLAQADVGFVGSVVYVGPSHVAQRIATLAELKNRQLAERFPAKHRTFLEPQPLRWDALSTPQVVFDSLMHEAGISHVHPEKLPHDLWPAYDLPPLTWAERVTLVLAGFPTSWQLDDAAEDLKLIGFPPAVVLRETYTIRSGVAQRYAELEQLFPQAFLKRDGRDITVGTTLEDHWKIRDMLNGKSRSAESQPAGPAEKRYTLTVQNQPLKAVLAALAQRLGLAVEYADGVEDAAGELVSFSVQDASREELFDAAVKPAGLRATLDGSSLRIDR